jgi:hypothetical protein
MNTDVRMNAHDEWDEIRRASEKFNVTTIVPGLTDAELAADLRRRTEAALAPVMEIMNEASRHGLVLGWGINRDQFGRNRIEQITVFKPL